jgi:hypothetical protein
VFLLHSLRNPWLSSLIWPDQYMNDVTIKRVRRPMQSVYSEYVCGPVRTFLRTKNTIVLYHHWVFFRQEL